MTQPTKAEVEYALSRRKYVATEPDVLQTLCQVANDYLALLDEVDHLKAEEARLEGQIKSIWCPHCWTGGQDE